MNAQMRDTLKARVSEAKRSATRAPVYAEKSERAKLEDALTAKFVRVIPEESPVSPSRQARDAARMLVDAWFRSEAA